MPLLPMPNMRMPHCCTSLDDLHAKYGGETVISVPRQRLFRLSVPSAVAQRSTGGRCAMSQLPFTTRALFRLQASLAYPVTLTRNTWQMALKGPAINL